jgi:DNA-binding NarL/FixJ family response regulator
MTITDLKNILIVDDHRMVRDGLKMMLRSQVDGNTLNIYEAETGENAIYLAKKQNFDFVIMDYQLPKMNGAEVISELLKLDSRLQILALSNSDEMVNIRKTMQAGAKGFILKNITPQELVYGIETILQGRNYYSIDIALKLLNDEEGVKPSRTKYNRKLTNRELAILKAVASEKSNDQIADEFFISKRTVEQHIHNILDKLQLKNRTNLVVYALKNNLV